MDLTVAVGGADPELGRRAAETFPYLVRVRAERPAAERRERHDPAQRPSDAELYAAFVRATTGADAPEDLVALFRDDARGRRRCARVSSRCGGSAPTATRSRSTSAIGT